MPASCPAAAAAEVALAAATRRLAASEDALWRRDRNKNTFLYGRLRVGPRDLTGRALRKAFPMPHLASVPEGRMVELPGRGRTFVVDVAGRQGAPTLVLLHALVCTGYLAWHPVLEELAGSYRVVVPDQRRHGRGIRSPSFRLEDCADDVAALPDLPHSASGSSDWGRVEFRSTSAWTAPAVLAALGDFNSKPWIGEVAVPTTVA